MSEVAAKELEERASRYAADAIRHDSQGSRGVAIQLYQKSIDVLVQLVKLYPDYKLNRSYSTRAMKYQERINQLKGTGSTYSDVPPMTAEDYEGNNAAAGANRTSPQIVEPLKSSFEDLVLKEKPKVKWNEVMGLDDAKKTLEVSIVFPVRRPDLFPLGWPRGILVYGPPGCGKTLLAAAIASEIKGVFFNADAASPMSKWLGGVESKASQPLPKAREGSENGQPSIVFLDEIDSIMGVRGEEVGGEVRVRNQFLKTVDGDIEKNRNYHVYVI